MATYNITHSCGHTESHQLFGRHSGFNGRDSKIEWLSTQPCTNCWKVEQDKKRAEKIAQENARSKELAQRYGLPALSGSEKQITWATTIRQQMIDSMESFITECDKPEWAPKCDALRESFSAVVLSNTDARWFIDHRDFGTVQNKFGRQLVDWIKQNRSDVLSAQDQQDAETK